jgi:predicted  nucleic acid-binding Zn-ribbon protein
LPQRVDELERLRTALAHENQAPTRTEDELDKFVAQVNVARADLLAKNARLENFEASLHLTPYEVHGERWSLGALDKRIARRHEDSKVVPDRAARLDLRSLTRINYSPKRRECASDEVEHLQFLRGEIVRQIKARREPLTSERDRARELVEVLDAGYEREEQTLRRQDKQMPEPKYESYQMRSLEASAEVLRDPTLLREVHDWERNLSKNEPEISWQGRAVAREIMSGIDVQEAKERLQNFLESKRVASLNLGDYRTGTLHEVEARSLTDYLARAN